MPSRFSDIIYPLLNIINPFHWITKIRNVAFDKGIIESRFFDIPVICIGNISVGGTGKTPHTEYLIELLREKGNIAVLSRGYGRATKGYIKADDNCSAMIIGDEPFQIKRKYNEITVAVDEKRVEGITLLLEEEKDLDVILLDDAYQHRYVKAGLNILLTDYNRPIWEDAILPFGRLREAANGVKRADIIIITKCPVDIGKDKQEYCKKRIKARRDTPIFFSSMIYGTPYPLSPTNRNHDISFSGMQVLLLTGIAKPAPLLHELEKRGASVTMKQYADHHNFSTQELVDAAKTYNTLKEGRKIILTTEKDASRLAGRNDLPQEIRDNTYVIPIRVSILDDKENMFNQKIIDYVTKNSRNSRISKG